ncbi:MAG: FAD-dependent oxidoreductase [Actinobacteria bacterium]|nr:FAD-dependent oxidoreductase [Actinomycetota bacterium]
MRTSMGRFGDTFVQQHSDDELASIATEDLRVIAGLPTTPVASTITRWDDSLPQYTVGHRERMMSAREELVSTPGISLCGAAYDGVGIPACIGSAQFAAGQVVGYLKEQGRIANG